MALLMTAHMISERGSGIQCWVGSVLDVFYLSNCEHFALRRVDQARAKHATITFYLVDDLSSVHSRGLGLKRWFLICVDVGKGRRALVPFTAGSKASNNLLERLLLSDILSTAQGWHILVNFDHIKVASRFWSTFKLSAVTLFISDIRTPSKETFEKLDLLFCLYLVLELEVVSVQWPWDESPLSDHHQKQVLICIEKTTGLSVEMHFCSARFDAASEAIFMEFICNLVEQSPL